MDAAAARKTERPPAARARARVWGADGALGASASGPVNLVPDTRPVPGLSEDLSPSEALPEGHPPRPLAWARAVAEHLADWHQGRAHGMGVVSRGEYAGVIAIFRPLVST